jgi:hypothetical protein
LELLINENDIYDKRINFGLIEEVFAAGEG